MRLSLLAPALLLVCCTPPAVPAEPTPDPIANQAVPAVAHSGEPAQATPAAQPLEVAEAPPPAPVVEKPPSPDPPPASSVAQVAGVQGPVPPMPVFNAAIKAKPVKTLAPSPDDPTQGRFSLADATKGLPARGTLVADIETSFGPISCRLLTSQAPKNVANFVGLARGLRPFNDPRTNTWVTRPAYDGTIFHRVIAGFMIQGGDPTGTGRGEPGYVVPDEVWAGGAHDRPGLLCTANRGPDTNGMQFFLTDGVTKHLDNGFTIFGVCEPTAIVHQIATVPKDQSDRPRSPVIINTVKIRRVPSP